MTGIDVPTLRRSMGPAAATTVVVGTVIGSGIFVTPARIAEHAGPWGFGVILAVWALCGLLSLAGALAYAELAAMFPASGGQYVFLREAYGPLWGFLFGWMEWWVSRAGSVATVAVGFATYARHFYHSPTPNGGDLDLRLVAAGLIAALSVANYMGVTWGAGIQVVFTAAKVAALGGLAVLAFLLPGGSSGNWEPWFASAPGGLAAAITAMGAASIQVLWAYDGWSNGAMVSEEVRDPQRTVPRAITRGTLFVTVIYLGATLAYHFLLPMDRVRSSDRVAADAASVLFGPAGGGLIAAAVLISTLGSVNGMMLAGPRVFFAMARDRLFFPIMARIHPRHATPGPAILLQGLCACVLVLVPFQQLANDLLGWKLSQPLFDQLLAYVVFGSWLFYGMTVAGLILLRIRRPAHPRPYRTWGYPVVPAAFVLTSVAFCLHTVWVSLAEAVAGLAILATGLPAYWWWRRQRSATPPPESG